MEQALVDHAPEIHHSDQGVQYAAIAYTTRLRDAGVQISMAQVGAAWQNGYAERLIRTIKEEEVDLSEYVNYTDAMQQLGRFLDEVYMHKRIHSALGYLTPPSLKANGSNSSRPISLTFTNNDGMCAQSSGAVQLSMNKKQNYFTGLTTNTFLLAFTSFFADISTEMLYPVLPIFLTQTLGANVSIVGIVEGVATATQNIVQGFSGWLADKLQKRKPIALFGYSLAALSKPLFGVASAWQFVLFTRFLDRFGTGMRSAPRDALIAGSADEKNRGKAFGLEGIGDNLGAFVGPLLAMLLLFTFHIGIRNIFYIAFIPGFLSVCMILSVKEKRAVVSVKSKLDLSLKKFPAKYWRYIGVTALFGIGNSSTSFLILQTKNIGTPFAITILIYAFFNLVAALISYPAGSLSDKFGRKNILLLSFIIFLFTYLGFAISRSMYIIGFLFILYGLFQGIFRAVGKALATDFVPSELRASGIGWYSTTVGLSSLIASIIGGQLWVLVNPSATFYFGALFAVLGSIGLFLFIHVNTNG